MCRSFSQSEFHVLSKCSDHVTRITKWLPSNNLQTNADRTEALSVGAGYKDSPDHRAPRCSGLVRWTRPQRIRGCLIGLTKVLKTDLNWLDPTTTSAPVRSICTASLLLEQKTKLQQSLSIPVIHNYFSLLPLYSTEWLLLSQPYPVHPHKPAQMHQVTPSHVSLHGVDRQECQPSPRWLKTHSHEALLDFYTHVLVPSVKRSHKVMYRRRSDCVNSSWQTTCYMTVRPAWRWNQSEENS